ncbi:hypothetical protein HK105_204350 [Polyrhizophydium stewartii]|uniref:Integral membrane protein n=1 Tax=Polyrhizophydium stewartii TaxID=2732419 RepID=A0ABR4N9X3_9FUNG|nr:hypothetical protein HK105_002707 [Polyrhizophydium stewartii]
MPRDFTAFEPPAAIFVGIAFSELAAAGMFMIAARREAWRGTILRLALAAWVLAAAIACTDAVVLDFLISPYPVSRDWHPKAVIAGMLFNLAITGVMLSLFIVRLRVFHQGRSPVFWGLLAVAVCTFVVSVPANIIGIMTNIEVIQGKVDRFSDSSLMGLSTALYAATHGLEGIFSAACSLVFLWAIGKGLGLSSRAFVSEVLLRHEGMRFMAILGLNLVVAGFAVDAFVRGAFTYVTYTSWFMTVMIYSIEINTFLLTSFVTSRDLITTRRHALEASAWSSHSQSQLQMQPPQPPQSRLNPGGGHSPTVPPAAATEAGGAWFTQQPQQHGGAKGDHF